MLFELSITLLSTLIINETCEKLKFIKMTNHYTYWGTIIIM